MPSDTFNAYHKWLGIPPAEQPPNHYRLLGISAFENDPEVIDRAADSRMIFLRQNQSGPNAHWSQQLLNEVSAARICLLDELAKHRYDAELQEQLDPGLVPLETALSPMLPEAGRCELPDHDPLAMKPKSTPPQPMVVAIAVGGTIVVSGLIAVGILLSVNSSGPAGASSSAATRPTVADGRALPPITANNVTAKNEDAAHRDGSTKQVAVPPAVVETSSTSLPPGWSTEVATAAPRDKERTVNIAPPSSAQEGANARVEPSTTAVSVAPAAAPAAAPAISAGPAAVAQPAASLPLTSTPLNSVAAQVSQPATGGQPGPLSQPGGLSQQAVAPQPGIPANPNVSPQPQLPGAQGQPGTPMMGPMRGMPSGGGFMPPFGPPPGFMPPFGAPGQMPGGQPGIPGQPMMPGQSGFGGPFGGPRTDSSSVPVDNSPVPPATLDDVAATLKGQNKSPQEVYNRLRALLHLPHDSSSRTELAALLDPLLTSENALVRSKARELMQTWGTEVNVPTLIKLLSVQDRVDRHDALKALGAIGGKESAHAVAARLTDKDDRSYAKAALIKMGPVAEEHVLPFVGDSNDDVHDAACDIVGLVGTNKSLSKLRALRRESSTRRRLSVSGAIHELEQRLVKKR